MDFDKFINNLNFKKVIFVVIVGFVGAAIVREIIFWEFAHTFGKVYSTFVTQFDKDQESIHDIIENASKEHDKWEKDFHKYSEEFHKEVEENFRSHAEFMNKPMKTSFVDERGQKEEKQLPQEKNENKETMDEDEAHEWEKFRNKYYHHTGYMLPAYDELVKQTNLPEIEEAKIKELTAFDKRNDETRLAWVKEEKAIKVKSWQEIQKRFLNKTGKTLPEFESIENVMAKKNN